MYSKKYSKLPLGDILPEGLLRQRLLAQCSALTGNVPYLFKDLSDSSAWLGGKGEAWERGPYYLDGLFPAAVLTKDKELKKRALHWFDRILSSQRDDGSFGPRSNSDRWPRSVFTKQLPSYFEYTGDERVIPFLTRYYTYMLESLDALPPYSWAAARGCEELMGIYWLYEKTCDKRLLDLCGRLMAACFDWTAEFSRFEFNEPSSYYMSPLRFNIKKVTFYAPDAVYNLFGGRQRKKERLIKRNENPFNRFYHLTHGVNLAMALKYPALRSLFDGGDGAAVSKDAYLKLMRFHGTAAGLFTCDEHLGKASPTGGIELCTVAEAMYSAEKLFEITGDCFWADLLELLAFNTLPATFTPDMTAHQYVQQVNQISATRAKRDWYDSYNNANIFGLKPNYACCLSNMHQGFPRFAEHLAMSSGNSLILVSPVSMKIETRLLNESVSLSVVSDYPYGENATVKITRGSFELIIRKPARCTRLFINGKVFCDELTSMPVAAGDILNITYCLPIVPVKNPDDSVSYYYGNLLLALPIEERAVFDDPGDRFSDRQFFPCCEWNYAPSEADLLSCKMQKTESPYRIEAVVGARRVDNWGESHNSAAPVPKQPVFTKQKFVRLVPYAETRLRIAQFPPCR